MKFPWTFASLLSVVSALPAYESVTYEDEPHTPSSLAAEPTSERQNTSFPSQPAEGQLFASARPALHGKWGAIVFGEFLYWTAKEEGLNYGTQSTYNTRPPFQNFSDPYKGPRGKIVDISPHYHAGYRLGFDLFLPHDGWDVLGRYTQYRNVAHSSIEQKALNIVWPIFLVNNGIPKSLSAKAKWELDYSVLDLELGRSFFLGRHLSVRPFFGFRAAWIEQTLKATFKDVVFFPFPPVMVPSLSMNNHNDFQGYGMRTGVQTKWPLGWGFSLLGDLGASLLWSKFHIAQFDKNANHTPRSHISDHLREVTPVLDLFGGMAWEIGISQQKFYLRFHGGWEQQVWFYQNQLNIFLGNSVSGAEVGNVKNMRGNLTLAGWTAGAQFGF